jgi:hypothetical protein
MSPRIPHISENIVETHLPLVSKLPNLRASRYSFDVKPLGPAKAPFCDVPNYASGGVTMMHFAVG